MATNKELLAKGVKYLFAALPLMFIGPSVMYNAFMNKDNNWHYVVLVVGCAICITAVFLAFKGIKTMTDSIFNDGK
ncbi:MAG: DUF6095 family protein [Bacteroidota bacterium]